MSEPSSNHALFNALSLVLNGNPNLHVLDYADPKTFRELWFNGLEEPTPTIYSQRIDWKDENAVLLLVGEDPPSEVFNSKVLPDCLKGINFCDHLTAASWATVWRIRFPEAKAHVLVLESNQHGASSVIAQSFGTLFGAYEANGSPLVPGVSLLRAPSLEELCSKLKPDAQGDFKLSPTVKAMLKTTIWEALTVNREDHHAVSNVLGALLMGSQVGRGLLHEDEPWPGDYLLALVQACGVEAWMVQAKLREDCDRQCWVSKPIQKEIEAAVLLDDLSDIWEPFLRDALGFAAVEEFQGRSLVTSPYNEFINEIQGLPTRLTDFINSDHHFLTADVLISGQHNINDRFILFLDLRLFPNGRGEGDFYRNIADFGIKLLASKRHLPWIDEAGKMRLRKELARCISEGQSGTGDSGTIPAKETLLARLLSLLDPTLPIIIFSSTHHADLIEPFRNYGNIITSFRKPILTDMNRDWTEAVKELHADFVSALEKAILILQTRYHLARLEATEPIAPLRLTRPRRIIEIYIDESGNPFERRDPGFAVGGIILQHDNESAQTAFHKAINEAPKKWGVSDYAPDRIYADQVAEKLPLVSYYPKRPTAGGPEEQEGLALVSSSLNQKSRIAAFALIEPTLLRLHADNQLDSAILFDRDSLDNIFHVLLRRNLEMLLFEHPWIDLKTDSFFIHIATREQNVHKGNTPRIWKEAYGIEFKQRKTGWSYTSLGPDSVFRLIRELLQARGALEGRPDIIVARGVTLNDYEDIVRRYRDEGRTPRVVSQLYNPTGPDPKQVHYLADWIIRMALYRKNLPECVTAWFKDGYIQPMSDEFLALLDACRLSARDSSVRRLLGITLAPVDQLRKGLLAERYLRQTASTWSRQLTDAQIHGLFSRI